MEFAVASVVITITFLVGIFVGFLVKKQEITRITDEKNEIKQKNEELISEIQNLKSQNASDKTKLEMLEQIQKIVKEDFTAIANKVIKEEQSDLREQNREALEEKLKPLKENLDEFKQKVEDFNKQGATNTAEIKTQIKTLLDESSSIKTTANDLSNAIKANSQVRGAFGEMILENLLQQAGLINKNDDEEKGNYITQHTFKDISAPTERPRPDAVVFFPDDKNIIVDSKCPLNNFLEFANSQDENERQIQLKLFYKSVAGMIEDLSGKYNNLEGLNTPQFKLMFIPLEACASYVYTQNDLIKKAEESNIIIVCPSTLLATLKTINKVWIEKNRKENFEEIIKVATSTYEALQRFVEKADKFHNKISCLNDDFEDLMKPIKGNQGIIKKIAKLDKLELPVKKKIKTTFTDEIDDDGETFN